MAHSLTMKLLVISHLMLMAEYNEGMVGPSDVITALSLNRTEDDEDTLNLSKLVFAQLSKISHENGH